MPSLYGVFPPTWQVPQTFTRRRPAVNPQVSAVSWRFDPELGDFLRDSRGRALMGSPLETTLLWGARAVSIQRAGWPIFSRAWGVGYRRIMRNGGPRRNIEQALEADMRRAVGPGPSGGRIRDAVSFAFDWSDPDILAVAYTLVLADGTRRRSGTQIVLAPLPPPEPVQPPQPPLPGPPTISNVTVTNISHDEATVEWDTNVESTGQVDYGTTPDLGDPSA